MALIAVVGALTWGNIESDPHPLPAGTKATKILILKSSRKLLLYRGDALLKTYHVSLGGVPVGAKEHEGDLKTPEGFYTIDYHNDHTSYHHSMHISYPRPDQVMAAKVKGIDPGGAIMIHGIRRGLGWLGAWQRCKDWTFGCVALTNPEVDEVYDAVDDGTPVEIRP